MLRRILGSLTLAGILFLVSCGGNESDTASSGKDTLSDTLSGAEMVMKELNDKIINDPNNPDLYFQRSNVYLSQGDYTRAMNDINRSLKIDSTQSSFHFAKGEIYYTRMVMDSAIACYQSSIRHNPEQTEPFFRIGRIYMYLKQFEIAMDWVNKGLKVQPDAVGYFMKGEIFEMTGDSAKAASSYQTATEVNPDYYDAYIRLGILYAASNSMMALEYYGTAIRLQPNNIEPKYNKAVFCQDHGMVDEALFQYDAILKLDPNNEVAFYNKGYCYLVHKGDYSSAEEMFTRSINLNPAFRDAYYNRGLAFEALKNYKKAREDYNKVLELDPQHEGAANALDNLDRKGLR